MNDHLREMDVEFIAVDQGVKDFSGVTSGDVVILPAFGATVQEMQLLNERGCHIVDTTLPLGIKVWTTVEKHKQTVTSIIHGKVKHEETLAYHQLLRGHLPRGARPQGGPDGGRLHPGQWRS